MREASALFELLENPMEFLVNKEKNCHKRRKDSMGILFVDNRSIFWYSNHENNCAVMPLW